MPLQCISTRRSERAFANRRRSLGLTVHQAATRLRVSAKYLRALEKGSLPLSLSLAVRMSLAYQTTVGDLVRPQGAAGTGELQVSSGNDCCSRRGMSCRDIKDLNAKEQRL